VPIRKGEPWGEPVLPPSDLPVMADDAAAGDWVRHEREAGRSMLPLGVAGGDLARTMGGGAPGRFSGTVVVASVDIVRVEVAGRVTWAVAHVIARRSWWRGEVHLAMNAQFLGTYDVAPRSHPNDGRVDLIDVASSTSVRTRLQARARARTGTHLPHPELAASQTAAVEWRFERPLDLWVDGRLWCRASSAVLRVEPDALLLHA
jgi:YegS C-terminal NAD kinase beta sandwich-like domain